MSKKKVDSEYVEKFINEMKNKKIKTMKEAYALNKRLGEKMSVKSMIEEGFLVYDEEKSVLSVKKVEESKPVESWRNCINVGDTVWIVAGERGNAGEECVVEKVDNFVWCRSKENDKLYDKYPKNVTKDNIGGAREIIRKSKRLTEMISEK